MFSGRGTETRLLLECKAHLIGNNTTCVGAHDRPQKPTFRRIGVSTQGLKFSPLVLKFRYRTSRHLKFLE